MSITERFDPQTQDIHGATSTSDDLIDHLLSVARARLGMELSWLSTFVGDDQVFDQLSGSAAEFGLRAGAATPLSESICARVLDGRLPNLITDTSADPGTDSLAVTEELGIGSYVGVPIRDTEGVAHGMLCCINRGDAQHLVRSDVHTLELIAELLAEIVKVGGPAERRRRLISSRVSEAITHQHFRIVYQPIIDVAMGSVVGAEALTRFSGGPTRPNVWFAEAASVGLGVDLELATIAAALVGLDQLEPSQYLAINASPQTVLAPRLLSMLAASQPNRIVVELTEHSAITSYEALGEAIDRLRACGVRIAVDDAGAGFSSLSHVLKIRPSLLKIDRSIVKGLEIDPARISLVQAIIDTAVRVEATIIAEGVETRADLDFIGSLGITHAQGYFLGRPAALPAAPRAPHADVGNVSSNKADLAGSELIDRRCELAMTHSPIGVALVSPQGSFLHVNPAFTAILGCASDDIATINFQDLIPADSADGSSKVVRDFLDGSRTSFRAEREFRRTDGQLRWGEVQCALIRSDSQPAYFLLHLQDITERRRRELSLAQRAGTDHLTGVANRGAARKRLDQLAQSSEPVAVMYCDLRSFKQINDSYGHQAGDHVLQTIARRLCLQVRPRDMVSRWGGDEFLVLLHDASPEVLSAIRDRIHEAVAAPIQLPHRVEVLVADITVGIASTDGCLGRSLDEVIHEADSDMYRQRQASITA